MSTKTSIQWTEASWNPVRGCSRISPGCGGASGEGGCYAERMAARFSGTGQPYDGLVRIGKNGPRWTGDVRLVPERLADPLRWRRPRRVFVNSMSDLFHEKLEEHEIARVFAVMALACQHTFQVLTKRAERMRAFLSHRHCCALVADVLDDDGMPLPGRADERRGAVLLLREGRGWPLPNVWIGASVEDQQRADERIPPLLDTPAAVRFVSYEPALGPIDFGPWLPEVGRAVECSTCGQRKQPRGRAAALATAGSLCDHECPGYWADPQPGDLWPGESRRDFGYPEELAARPSIDWLIVGGESGHGARAFDPQWARDVIAQCRAAGVSVFVKQLGPNPAMLPVPRDRKGGDPAEWPADLRVREFPEVM